MILDILHQPYSAPKGEMAHAIYSILFGLFIGIFLVAFEPFNIDKSPYPYRPWSVMLFGVFSTVVLLISFYLLPKLLPNIYNDKIWKVWHHIALFSISILGIAMLNGLYVNFLFDLPFEWGNFWWMIGRTFGLGCIPASIFILMDHNRLLKSNLQEAKSINKYFKTGNQSVSPQSTAEHIYHLSDNGKPKEISESEISYIEADGNYINVITTLSESVKQEVLRSSIRKTESENNSKSIIRCHRSYMVNLNKVKEISGNAQGLKLSLVDADEVVPVSRKYIAIVREGLNQKK